MLFDIQKTVATFLIQRKRKLLLSLKEENQSVYATKIFTQQKVPIIISLGKNAL